MEHRPRNSYSGDPYWITVKFSGRCARCKKVLPPGARAFYYPRQRQLFCDSPGCGQAESNSFESAAADEFFYESLYTK